MVNVASKCGLTPQYEGLEALYRDDKGRGLEILGFPCNQFKEQEPGTDEEMQEFSKTNYDVTFPVFAKIDINGPGADRCISTWYPGSRRLRPAVRRPYQAISKIRPGSDGTDEIKWNFTKFLIGRAAPSSSATSHRCRRRIKATWRATCNPGRCGVTRQRGWAGPHRPGTRPRGARA